MSWLVDCHSVTDWWVDWLIAIQLLIGKLIGWLPFSYWLVSWLVDCHSVTDWRVDWLIAIQLLIGKLIGWLPFSYWLVSWLVDCHSVTDWWVDWLIAIQLLIGKLIGWLPFSYWFSCWAVFRSLIIWLFMDCLCMFVYGLLMSLHISHYSCQLCSIVSQTWVHFCACVWIDWMILTQFHMQMLTWHDV